LAFFVPSSSAQALLEPRHSVLIGRVWAILSGAINSFSSSEPCRREGRARALDLGTAPARPQPLPWCQRAAVGFMRRFLH
ncbi:MAG: hypothetical protein WCZ18_12400, partial [Ottowia sp.]